LRRLLLEAADALESHIPPEETKCQSCGRDTHVKASISGLRCSWCAEYGVPLKEPILGEVLTCIRENEPITYPAIAAKFPQYTQVQIEKAMKSLLKLRRITYQSKQEKYSCAKKR
jgi:hypothetical protein